MAAEAARAERIGGLIMSGNRDLNAYRPTLWLASIAGVAVLGALSARPIHAATDAKPSSPAPEREQLNISPEVIMKPWTGDLDGTIERGVIRVLTVYSKVWSESQR
jgi:hypothetical protein